MGKGRASVSAFDRRMCRMGERKMSLLATISIALLLYGTSSAQATPASRPELNTASGSSRLGIVAPSANEQRTVSKIAISLIDPDRPILNE
jgi:hypothetical protein